MAQRARSHRAALSQKRIIRELSDSNFNFCGRARWGLPSAWAAAISSPVAATAAGPLRYCRKAPEDSAPRQRRPTLPVRRFSKPRGRRRSRGGFCGGPCGRQTPAGLDAHRQNRSISVKRNNRGAPAVVSFYSSSMNFLPRTCRMCRVFSTSPVLSKRLKPVTPANPSEAFRKAAMSPRKRTPGRRIVSSSIIAVS